MLHQNWGSRLRVQRMRVMGTPCRGCQCPITIRSPGVKIQPHYSSISKSRTEICSVETTVRPYKCNEMDLMVVVALTYVMAPGLSTYEYQDIQMLSSQEERKEKTNASKNKYQIKSSYPFYFACSQANNRMR